MSGALLRMLARFSGAVVLSHGEYDALSAASHSVPESASPESKDRGGEDAESGPDGEIDYQREASKYHVRTGTGDMEPGFLAHFEACRRFTMTSAERMYGLYSAVRYVQHAGVEGDIVECGVWRGGSMMLVARTLCEMRATNRDLYLFDTYEGLPRPDDDVDVDIWGNRAIDGWRPHARDERSSSWALAGLDEVRENLAGTGYPSERMYFVKGMVEETIPDAAPASIAILRLDTDWYASTQHEIEELFPRLNRDGVLIIDDYGHFKGARKAVDEYIEANDLPLLLNRIDYTGRMAIKNF